jgi:hypothetical protein
MTEYSINVHLVKNMKKKSLGAYPKEKCCASLITTIYETYKFKGHVPGHSQILNE